MRICKPQNELFWGLFYNGGREVINSGLDVAFTPGNNFPIKLSVLPEGLLPSPLGRGVQQNAPGCLPHGHSRDG